VWVLETVIAVDVGNQSSPLLFSWITCLWVLEAAIAVDVPSASVVVVTTAIKTKIDIFLAVVFMLTPEQRYSLYEIGLT
jgi:hypothetical protein